MIMGQKLQAAFL